MNPDGQVGGFGGVVQTPLTLTCPAGQSLLSSTHCPLTIVFPSGHSVVVPSHFPVAAL